MWSTWWQIQTCFSLPLHISVWVTVQGNALGMPLQKVFQSRYNRLKESFNGGNENGNGYLFSCLKFIVSVSVESERKPQIRGTVKPCFPDTGAPLCLLNMLMQRFFLMRFSVLRAAGWPLTLRMICFRLQTCAATTTARREDEPQFAAVHGD